MSTAAAHACTRAHTVPFTCNYTRVLEYEYACRRVLIRTTRKMNYPLKIENANAIASTIEYFVGLKFIIASTVLGYST